MSKYPLSVINKKHKCLYCLHSFFIWESPFRENNSRQNLVPDFEYGNYWGIPNPPKVTSKVYNELANKYVGIHRAYQAPNDNKIKDRICPKCRSELPSDFFERESISIYVIGIRSSGKTAYLSAALDSLKTRLSSVGVFIPKSDNIEDLVQGYRSGRYASATSASVRQRPYVLRGENKSSGQAVYISLFDIAGETLNDPAKIQHISDSLAHADGYIMIVDPTQDEAILNVSKFPNPALQAVQGSNTILDMTNAVNNFCAFFKREVDGYSDKKIDKPIVFLLSKIDALHSEIYFSKKIIDEKTFKKFLVPDSVFQKANLMSPSSIIKKLNEESDAVIKLIKKSKLRDIPVLLHLFESRFSEHRAYMCSAYPEGEQVNPEPLRVVDPILWIMSQRELLPNQLAKSSLLKVTTLLFFFSISFATLYLNKSTLCTTLNLDIAPICEIENRSLERELDRELEREEQTKRIENFVPTQQHHDMWARWKELGFVWERVEGGELNRVTEKTYVIPEFAMLRSEVTNLQYHACVKSGICEEPKLDHVNCSYLYEGVRVAPQKPISCLTFEQAQTFAKFAIASIPTDIQWLYAATNGGVDLSFPQLMRGAQAERFRLCDQDQCLDQGTIKVCTLKDQGNRFGLCDMIGNLSEYVLKEGIVPESGYVFGGSYNDSSERTSAQTYYQPSEEHLIYTGLRLIVPSKYLKGYEQIQQDQ